MNSLTNFHTNPAAHEAAFGGGCDDVRAEFSAYLDGEMTGVAMAGMESHLQGCVACAAEFSAWRSVQRSLVELGRAPAPARLQADLRAAVAVEQKRGSHLPLSLRAAVAWQRTLAPLALRVSGGLVAAMLLLGSFATVFAPLSAVQANDDNLAHLIAPRYLYSQVPPQPIATHRDVPIVVEAQVDTHGRVYDYAILEGPKDDHVEVQVEQNLLASVFKPATVFGIPVRGHVVLTYTGVSVKG